MRGFPQNLRLRPQPLFDGRWRLESDPSSRTSDVKKTIRARTPMTDPEQGWQCLYDRKLLAQRVSVQSRSGRGDHFVDLRWSSPAGHRNPVNDQRPDSGS